jgi:hypothetical protein
MMMSNPLLQAYDAMMAAVAADPTIIQLAKKNIINYDTDDANPDKSHKTSKDLPELRLLPGDVQFPGTTVNKCTTEMIYTMSWVLITGQQGIKQQYFPLQWAIYRSMIALDSTISGLLYEGLPFVTNLNIRGGPGVLGDVNHNTEITGWSCLWRVDLQLRFNKEVLKGEYNE